MPIDRGKIISEMSRFRVSANESGMIPVFGVYVQQLPADFWNGFARRLVNNVPEELVEAAETLLVNAAQECGYHTGHGIMTSPEWARVVSPLITRKPEDEIHGLFAVATAWGWGKMEAVRIDPDNIMIVRAYDYYESDVMITGVADRPSAYMIRGVSAAFMDLAYGGPYDSSGLQGLRTFKCEQTKGIERGDDYGEFVVTPAGAA